MLEVLSASGLVAAATLSACMVVWIPQQRLRRALPSLQAPPPPCCCATRCCTGCRRRIAGVTGRGAGRLLWPGVLGLFAVECVLRASKTASRHAPFARVDVMGDAIHHLIDGLVIGASFGINRELGWVIALAILARELPRELGNAGTLVAGGHGPRRAYALSTQATLAIPRGAFGSSLIGAPQGSGSSMAADATLYLACADLIPSLWTILAPDSPPPGARRVGGCRGPRRLHVVGCRCRHRTLRVRSAEGRPCRAPAS